MSTNLGLAGGLNLHAYADANPTTFTDPLGLHALTPEEAQLVAEGNQYFASQLMQRFKNLALAGHFKSDEQYVRYQEEVLGPAIAQGPDALMELARRGEITPGTIAAIKLLAPWGASALAQRTAAGLIGSQGALTIEAGGQFSASEIAAARYMAAQGRNVLLRQPVGTRAGGRTSDLLVDGVRYDVYTPRTANPNRIISAIASKNSQAEGIVLDLSKTQVTPDQLGDVLRRVQGAGAANIRDVVIIGK